MWWVVLGLLVFAILVLIIVDAIWRPHMKNLSQESLPGVVRQLLISKENGGHSRIDFRGSNVWFSFERLSGSDTDAVLALRIPRRSWTEVVIDSLRQSYAANGFEFQDEDGNPSLIGRVLIPIEDIWNETSGAKGAHAARILINLIELPKSARFDVDDAGPASKRILNQPRGS